MEETTDTFSSAPEGQGHLVAVTEREILNEYKHNFFISGTEFLPWRQLSMIRGNALTSLICVGESAGAEVSDLKELEVRKTPIIGKEKGILRTGEAVHIGVPGVGEISIFSSILF